MGLLYPASNILRKSKLCVQLNQRIKSHRIQTKSTTGGRNR